MELSDFILEKWTTEDVKKLEQFLVSKRGSKEKCEWEKNVVNTTLPCLAIPSKEIVKLSKEISKGNYLSLLDIFPYNYHIETIIIGFLICQIKDFELFKKYLDIYAKKCDNWATCDTLKFKINSKNEDEYFHLAKQYISSEFPFVRRIGLRILFSFTQNEKFLDEIFSMLNKFENENEYYVNMILAWLVCELFIKQREKTLAYLKKHRLNKFVINKAISKCHDSFRVSSDDKMFLKKYRVK